MTDLHDDKLVAFIDLRFDLDQAADRAALDGLFRDTLRDAHLRSADVSRVLVMDTAADLVAHQEAYERICSHPGVSAVLCLAVGPPPGRTVRPAPGSAQGRSADGAGPGDGPVIPRQEDRTDGAHPAPEAYHEAHVLDIPAQLAQSLAATLWVGDVRGIGWRPGQSGALSLTDTGDAPDDVRQLAPLRELLRVPEVFDEAVRAVGDMRSAVASPALRLLVHEVPEEDLMRAQLQALGDCTGSPVDTREGAELTGVLAVLAGAEPPEDLSVGDCLPEDGRLREAYWETERLMREAGSGLQRLSRWDGFLRRDIRAGGALEALREAGSTLLAYREMIERTFGWVDGRAGLDADSRDHLASMGIQLPHVPGTRPEEVGATLRRQVLSRLERGRPLPEIVSWLRDFADRTVPSGSAAQIDRIAEACPDAVPDALMRPPAFSVASGAPRAAVWAGLAALLAILGPTGLWGAAVVLLLVGAAAVWAAATGPDTPAEDGGEGPAGAQGALGAEEPAVGPPAWSGLKQALAVLGLGCLAGGLAGVAASVLLPLPGWTGSLALVLATVTTAHAAHTLWTAALRDWRTRLGLEQAASAAEHLGEVLDQGVLKYWLLADARAASSDQARALAALVQTVCDTLEDFADQLARRARSSWTSAGAAAGSGAAGPAGGRTGTLFAVEYVGQAGHVLRETLVRDLSDLVAESLDPYWHVVLRDPSAVSSLPAGTRTDGLIHEYQQQLARIGAAPAPPFARSPEERPDPATLVGVNLQRVVEVLSPDSRAGTLQLCSPDQLRMLDRSPGATRSVGFVPQVMQGPFWRALQDESSSGRYPDDDRGAARPAGRERWAEGGANGLPEIVWTTSGRFAGLLRFVPLSAGAVGVVWPGADGEATAGPGTAESGAVGPKSGEGRARTPGEAG